MSKEDQKKAAMDELFGGLTTPSSPSSPQEGEQRSATVSSKQKKYKELLEEKYEKTLDERVCTIMEVEIMNKLRYIAGKEGIALRDLFGTGAKLLIKEYEKEHGEIRVRKSKSKKGDVSKLFNV